jgi:phage gpG-like protein
MARIRLDRRSLRAAIRDQMPAILQAAGDRMGAVLEQQTKRRFDEGGDAEARWAPLWINNSAAVSRVTVGERADRKRSQVARNTRRSAERTKQRAIVARDRGDMPRSKANRMIRRAEAKANRAEEIARLGTTDARREGGEPLRDTGALQASFTNLATVAGTTLRIEVGSPFPHAEYHHRGFSTRGPNYIPLTQRAKAGWTDRLIPGYDFVILQGVTVPARPIVRLSARDREELTRSWAEG